MKVILSWAFSDILADAQWVMKYSHKLNTEETKKWRSMEQGSGSPLNHLLKRLEVAGKSKSSGHQDCKKKIKVAQTERWKFTENVNLHTLFTYKVTKMPSLSPLYLQVCYLLIPTQNLATTENPCAK